MRLRTEDRERVRAYWRGHCEAWRLSGLTQREYCGQNGVGLKSFGNWRAQFKREALAGPHARWGRYPRLRPMTSPRTNPMTNETRAPAQPAARPRLGPQFVPPPGERRTFSDDLKRQIVDESCLPNASVTAVARRYRIATSLLFGGGGLLVSCPRRAPRLCRSR